MPVVLTALSDWWTRIVGLLGLMVAAFGGWRAWLSLRADGLRQSRENEKALKADVARLLREATVRIDNEQEYLKEIDSLQSQVTAQRERINRLLDDISGRKQDAPGSSR